MKPLVISFTHSDYCTKSGGTEKFVRSISRLLQNQDVAHLNVSAFINKGVQDKSIIVNFNDRFDGVYTIASLLGVVDAYMRKGYTPVAIHIQHLLHQNMDMVKETVLTLKVPVYYVMHDFYNVCVRYILINTAGEYCMPTAPSKSKCKDCEYYEEGSRHYQRMQRFFDDISLYLKYMIAPSEYVARYVKAIYGRYTDKIIVRPHLKVYGTKEHSMLDGKIRLAYAGAAAKSKGYETFLELTEYIRENCPDAFDLYYLGKSKDSIPGVTSVYVSTAEQGDDAMLKALREYEITAALIWPFLGETYSYVYYELSAAGVYCLTNPISGNICDQVKINGNGIVFDDFSKLKDWISKPVNAKNEINKYRLTGEFRPERYVDNDSLEELLDPSAISISAEDRIKKLEIKKKPKKQRVLSTVYKMKKSKFYH